MGVIESGATPPYGHIVNVVRIESDHPSNDTAFHNEDVIYFDDHGLFTKVYKERENRFHFLPNFNFFSILNL